MFSRLLVHQENRPIGRVVLHCRGNLCSDAPVGSPQRCATLVTVLVIYRRRSPLPERVGLTENVPVVKVWAVIIYSTFWPWHLCVLSAALYDNSIETTYDSFVLDLQIEYLCRSGAILQGSTAAAHIYGRANYG